MSCTSFFLNHMKSVEGAFKSSNIVHPQVNYGFHYTHFHETCNCSMLHAPRKSATWYYTEIPQANMGSMGRNTVKCDCQ